MIPHPVHPVVTDRDYCAIINVRKRFFFSYTQTLAGQACRSRSCFDGLDESRMRLPFWHDGGHMNYTECEFDFDRVEETKGHIRDIGVS